MDAIQLDGAQRRFLVLETTISGVLCGVLPTSVMWFVFSPFPETMWGEIGLAPFLVKSTGMCVLLMTIIMTLVTRMRVRKGTAPGITAWTRQDHRWLRLVPATLWLRAPAFALLGIAILGIAGGVAAAALGLLPMDRTMFSLFNLIHGALIGLVMTPLIMLCALTDR